MVDSDVWRSIRNAVCLTAIAMRGDDPADQADENNAHPCAEQTAPQRHESPRLGQEVLEDVIH